MRINGSHIALLSGIVLLLWYAFCLPKSLFSGEYSRIVVDRDGHLIGTSIAEDEQWRFPPGDSIPDAFAQAVISFEDKRFYSHPGVDPLAVCRAVIQNIKNRQVLSGASTLSMQVIRLSRPERPRSIKEKLIEMILATRLELRYSKDEILRLWAAHAPMGGNIVGLEAAAWRYYGRSPENLSLSECATLAVLPNAPGLMHPGRNRDALRHKRNRLLSAMKEDDLIDQSDYELALLEDIPQVPKALPHEAYHFSQTVLQSSTDLRSETTLQSSVQSTLYRIADNHHAHLSQKDIQNLAILVLDTRTGEVLGYMGNAPGTKEEAQVDMVQSARSSGSVLKPFLHAAMLDRSEMSPYELRMDVPVSYSGFAPENYHRRHQGAVPADRALSQSLNVPAVGMLQDYGVEAFLRKLEDLGFSTIDRGAEDYGLSLILGGAEVSLWELCGAYAQMGRQIQYYSENQGNYPISGNAVPRWYRGAEKLDAMKSSKQPPLFSAGAIHHTLEALRLVQRPDSEGNWQDFYSARPLAWKTGTSFGHRDAWAVGVNARYTIGVWVGNADGEGRHGLVGIHSAGPILFDVLNSLPGNSPLPIPHDDLDSLDFCKESGFLASAICPHIDRRLALRTLKTTRRCPYHKAIHLDASGQQAYRHCGEGRLVKTPWFILPAAASFYYAQYHPEYEAQPSWNPNCSAEIEGGDDMSIIYPSSGATIYLPKGRKDAKEKAVLRAVHRDPQSQIHWHLNDQYLGTTTGLHHMKVDAEPGKYLLTVVDSKGKRVKKHFEVQSGDM